MTDRKRSSMPAARWVFALAAAFLLVIGVSAMTRTAEAASWNITGGQADWGFRTSFRNYVTGPIAKGSINLGGGASGAFSFPAAASGTYDDATGALNASFNGSVQFLGHDYGQGHVLDMSISGLRVETSGSSGTLYATLVTRPYDASSGSTTPGAPQTYSNVAFATLSGVSISQSGTTISASGISVALTAAGAQAFAGFYNAGEQMDSLSFSLTLAAQQTEPTATSTTVAATATATSTVAATTTGTPATATPTVSGTQQPAGATATSVPATATPRPGGSQITPAATGDGGLLVQR